MMHKAHTTACNTTEGKRTKGNTNHPNKSNQVQEDRCDATYTSSRHSIHALATCVSKHTFNNKAGNWQFYKTVSKTTYYTVILLCPPLFKAVW